MCEFPPNEIIGVSEEAVRLRHFVESCSRSMDPVLITGEPGTGKQMIARLIHEKSHRKRAPFLMIDCSLFYERELRRELFGYTCGEPGNKSRKGLLEFSSKGTCYLSRVEELSPGLQADLLEFLRSGKFLRLGDGKSISSGVRLIASSEKNLAGFVEAGLFAPDLYAHLAKQAARVPSLRDRPRDVASLIEFVRNVHGPQRSDGSSVGFSPEAIQALEAYPWPANLDEFSKEVRRLLESGLRTITPGDLAPEVCNYWLGQKSDPGVRRVIDELDACIREFKILSKLDDGLDELLQGAANQDWSLVPETCERQLP